MTSTSLKPNQPPSVRRLLLSREQACEMLGGISISSIIRLEREGRLTPVKLRKDRPASRTYYSVKQVEALAGVNQ